MQYFEMTPEQELEALVLAELTHRLCRTRPPGWRREYVQAVTRTHKLIQSCLRDQPSDPKIWIPGVKLT